MGTILFDKVIFGPIRSRRLGISLGVNLLPTEGKLCNFDCVYCECGWNREGRTGDGFAPRKVVREALRERLSEMVKAGEIPDVITFSGNGEPTMHPDFEGIIDDTLALRDEIAPTVKVSVLSNATMIGREAVRRALLRVDNNILKLDSAIDATVRAMDNPPAGYSVAETVSLMKLFGGRMILQTMFLRGECAGKIIDNTTEDEVAAWLGAVKEISPARVMIYTIDRETPAKGLQKITAGELEKIAAKVREMGMECSVSV